LRGFFTDLSLFFFILGKDRHQVIGNGFVQLECLGKLEQFSLAFVHLALDQCLLLLRQALPFISHKVAERWKGIRWRLVH
jgi:hypothetical protein